jgi:hypothetical protein
LNGVIDAATIVDRSEIAPIKRRIGRTAVAVPAVIVAFGAVGAVQRPLFVLVATAVIFGWSQLTST